MSFGYPAEAPFDGEHLFLCQSPYGGGDYPDRISGRPRSASPATAMSLFNKIRYR
jgi:hypothetical protein